MKNNKKLHILYILTFFTASIVLSLFNFNSERDVYLNTTRQMAEIQYKDEKFDSENLSAYINSRSQLNAFNKALLVKSSDNKVIHSFNVVSSNESIGYVTLTDESIEVDYKNELAELNSDYQEFKTKLKDTITVVINDDYKIIYIPYKKYSLIDFLSNKIFLIFKVNLLFIVSLIIISGILKRITISKKAYAK